MAFGETVSGTIVREQVHHGVDVLILHSGEYAINKTAQRRVHNSPQCACFNRRRDQKEGKDCYGGPSPINME